LFTFFPCGFLVHSNNVRKPCSNPFIPFLSVFGLPLFFIVSIRTSTWLFPPISLPYFGHWNIFFSPDTMGTLSCLLSPSPPDTQSYRILVSRLANGSFTVEAPHCGAKRPGTLGFSTIAIFVLFQNSSPTSNPVTKISSSFSSYF